MNTELKPGPATGHLRPKFTLGQVVITPGAQKGLRPEDMLQSVARHAHGDWGNLCDEDRRQNEEALNRGGRLFSTYHSDGKKFWIITEADRSVTTVLLPEEY